MYCSFTQVLKGKRREEGRKEGREREEERQTKEREGKEGERDRYAYQPIWE